MRWNVVNRKVSHRDPIVGVCPEVLSGEVNGRDQWSGQKRRTYPYGVLSSGSNPRRLCQVEEHGGGLIRGVDLL